MQWRKLNLKVGNLANSLFLKACCRIFEKKRQGKGLLNEWIESMHHIYEYFTFNSQGQGRRKRGGGTGGV